MIFHNVDQLTKYISTLPNNFVLGVTSGCFDIMHTLHVDYLNKCRRRCDFLIVLIDTDLLYYANKKQVPAFNENDRAYMLDNTKPVDAVCYIDSLDEYKRHMNSFSSLINSGNKTCIRLFKNSDQIYGTPVISGDRMELNIIPDVTRFSSSTEIKDFLKK